MTQLKYLDMITDNLESIEFYMFIIATAVLGGAVCYMYNTFVGGKN